jgi:hypothetical protein
MTLILLDDPTFSVYLIHFLTKKGEIMAKDTHRGCLLLHISPPYILYYPHCHVYDVTIDTCVLSRKFISPLCKFFLVSSSPVSHLLLGLI